MWGLYCSVLEKLLRTKTYIHIFVFGPCNTYEIYFLVHAILMKYISTNCYLFDMHISTLIQTKICLPHITVNNCLYIYGMVPLPTYEYLFIDFWWNYWNQSSINGTDDIRNPCLSVEFCFLVRFLCSSGRKLNVPQTFVDCIYHLL